MTLAGCRGVPPLQRRDSHARAGIPAWVDRGQGDRQWHLLAKVGESGLT